jgi:hypothetical protein
MKSKYPTLITTGIILDEKYGDEEIGDISVSGDSSTFLFL